nr:reverse transcriptase domain-containing protein [Tanacetum cinerariifolium]
MASITMTSSFFGALAPSKQPSTTTTSLRGLVVMANATKVEKKEESGRRVMMFAVAAAAAASVAKIAMAAEDEEPKRGTAAAKKKYGPVCLKKCTKRRRGTSEKGSDLDVSAACPEALNQDTADPNHQEREIQKEKQFKMLEKGVFYRLGDKGKSMSAYSNDSRRQSYHSSRKDTESCYQSCRSRGTQLASEKRHNKRASSRRTEVLSESEGGILTLKSSKIIPIECAAVSGPEGQPSAVNQSIEERIKVAINPKYPEQTIMIGSTLTEEGRNKLCDLLQRNLDVFSWKPTGMTGVPRHISKHRLNVRERCPPVRQKKIGQAADKNQAIQEEVEKLGYHQIKMAKEDEEKTTFITSQGIFCYSKMPFGLRNVGATYQRLVDKAFHKQVGRNLELNGKLASLNRFLAKSTKKSLPFFKTLKICTKKSDFHWTEEAMFAFKQMKQFIAKIPTLNAPEEKEELIVYLAVAKEAANADSRLVANQVNETYIAKEADMIRYLEKVRTLTNGFRMFSIKQVSRSENKKADALSKITSTSFAHLTKHVLVKELKEKSINELKVLAVVEEEWDTWMTSIYEYLTEETLPAEEVDMVQNDEAFEINLDLLEERREQAAIREAKSKSKMERYYNSKVCITSFKPGDVMYRSNDASRTEERGKLGPKWEGPY